ncbi:UDP-glycosyltransferase 86A1-like isoform X2 [Henckelia pumila]|uniref:UDP-glycosyltransferase 86A1-like isoform X2 n=1 Tax=Henckelia pumila TaxID=405737 RepID=UPI003C6E6C02
MNRSIVLHSLRKMAEARSCKLHALMFPLPYQGHINPFVDLAIKLASKGFTITFVHTQYIYHTLTNDKQTDLFSQARKSGLDITCCTIYDGFPVDFDRRLQFVEYFISLLNDFPGRVDEFMGNMIGSGSSSPPVSVLIADSFFAWSPWIANKYGLVNVSFFTQPALAFAIGCHWELLTQNGHFPVKDTEEEEITYVPGVDAISSKNLMSYFKEEEIGTPIHNFVFAAFHEMNRADFVLHHTVQELESKTLTTLSKNQPTYAIGPVYSFTNRPDISLRSESDCAKWLDSKPPGSVLYVSFGSVVQTTKQVIQEIAYGLLLSGVNFLWVAREDILDSGDSDIFPDGFQDETKDRGLIVPWCDQIMVLSNAGVGGFVTHCGWNSTLESMWFGVPMICNPVAYDQPTNRKLVVEDLKIGINLSDGESIHRQQVAEKIRGFMNASASQGLRDRSEKVKKILHNALDIGGSSQRNLDKFIEDLTAKIVDV